MDLRALVFMPALVGAVVFAFVFLLFACNYYLTVLESTAAGAREITWTPEPILDNAWKLAYLGWLVGLWFGPAYLIGLATTGADSPRLTFAIPLLVLWICYPISQLSSLSASSIWIPLVPDVFVRLVQKPGVVFVFFALSAATLAVFGLSFHWAFVTAGEWPLLFVGAPLVVVSGLLYARLLGRLAFALRFTTGLFPARKKKKRRSTDASEARPKTPAPVVQPADLPALNSPEGELSGYNILTADDPPATTRTRIRAEVVETANSHEPPTGATPVGDAELSPRPAQGRARLEDFDHPSESGDDADELPTAYGVKSPEVAPVECTPQEVIHPSAAEMALLNRDDAPKKPRRVWGLELLAFLVQPGTVSAIIIASGLCFAVGAMIRVAREYNPVAGGG